MVVLSVEPFLLDELMDEAGIYHTSLLSPLNDIVQAQQIPLKLGLFCRRNFGSVQHASYLVLLQIEYQILPPAKRKKKN